MAFYHRNGERKKIAHDFRRQEEEVVGSLCRLGNRPISPKSLLEQEKRIRREIANSNERRRMQSINAGFQSLRTLLPHREGEKLSKAAILQNTADYIYQLEQEKTRLLEQNCQLKRRVLNSQNNQDSDGSCSDSPLPKRKKRDAGDSLDEGTGSLSPSSSENCVDDVKRELLELRLTLEQERNLRIILEKQVRTLESQLYPADSVSDVNHPGHQHHSGAEQDSGKPSSSVMTMTVENGLSSPQSHISNQDIESLHDVPLRESSPELSIEVPEDLSGKNNSVLLPCVSELSISDVATLPGLLVTSDALTAAPSSFQSEQIEMTPRQIDYKASTSRQNLETIVEAIRHVEGEHMFRDDPVTLSDTRIVQWTDEVKTETEEQCEEQDQQTLHSLLNADFSFQHQIIRNAPITQSRPGVIVSNHS